MSSERWGGGQAYESFMGRWSRLVARRFVSVVPVAAGADWVDVGCGTGAVSSAVLDLASPRSVVGIDPATGFVEHAAAAIHDPRFSAHLGDAISLGLPEDSADAVVSGLALNFVPDPVAALDAARQVVRPGGLVGGYVWDYAEGMGMLRVFWQVAGELEESARAAAEGARFGLCHPEPLSRALRDAGLEAIEVTALEQTAEFDDFDDYWIPFLGGQGPAAGYVSTLSDARRDALRDRLREVLPTGVDGRIELPLRAWAFWGTA